MRETVVQAWGRVKGTAWAPVIQTLHLQTEESQMTEDLEYKVGGSAILPQPW